MRKISKKYLNHTQQEIEIYLAKFKKLVSLNYFFIPTNDKRVDNKKFIEKYHLTHNLQKKILLSLQSSDFCYSVDNKNQADERLYVFSKKIELDNWGKLEKITIYFKITIKSDNYAVIISMHTLKKRIKKLFLRSDKYGKRILRNLR